MARLPLPPSTNVQNSAVVLLTPPVLWAMLASDQPTADPRSFASLTMCDSIAQLMRYRGCQAGWQPIGRPRSADDAARLRDLLQRIAPNATLRISSAT